MKYGVKSYTKFYAASLLLISFSAATALAETSAPASDRAIPKITDSLARVCESPRSPLYTAKSNFDRVEVELVTDFTGLNESNYNSNLFPAVIKVATESSPSEIYPILLSQRGNSRRQFCQVRPFRIQFLSSEIKKKIEALLSEKGIKPDSSNYLKDYYSELNQTNYATEAQSLKEGLFKHLGDDVKFVTHCGNSNWEFIGGKSDEEQNTKIFSEYTIYKVLEPLKLPIEATRFAAIKYYDKEGKAVFAAADGSALAKPGFFREPPKSTAERCGLFNKLNGENKLQETDVDSISEVQTNLINKFVFNNDFEFYGHNMNRYYDTAGKVVYGPYDFDLSGIFVDGYFKNRGSLEDNLTAVMEFVRSNKAEIIKPTLQRMINAKAEMKAVITTSEISDTNKERFNKWLDLYIGSFETYLTENK